MSLDLDQLEAARAEVAGNAPTVTFRGEEYILPRELPFGVFLHLRLMENEPAKALEAMDLLISTLFKDQKSKFIDSGPSLEDVKAIMEGLTEAYGISVGEVPASGD